MKSANLSHNPHPAERDALPSRPVSRRSFLAGSATAGAVARAAVSGGVLTSAALAATGCSSDTTPTYDVLTVPTDRLSTTATFSEISQDECFELVAEYTLPYGTLIFNSCDEVAACLLPTDSASPLTQIGLVFTETGTLVTAVKEAVGADEGFEIIDVRANATGIIWVESQMHLGTWRVYTATMNGMGVGEAVLAEEGDAGWELPSIAAVDEYGYWQVLPLVDGAHDGENSLLKKTIIGRGSVQTVYTSPGRMATPIYPLEDALVITPRTDAETVHYQLTLLDPRSDKVRDSLILPSNMVPTEAGYGTNGFTFCFDAIYSYGDGISNLGTYTPLEAVSNSKYSDARWFSFVRTPTAPPAWCGDYFVVKSTTVAVGIDLARAEYCIIDIPEGTQNYGDYLATTGTSTYIITYCNVDYEPIDGTAEYGCKLRRWRAK